MNDFISSNVPSGLGPAFASDYLRTYYCGDVTADEKIVLSFLAESWRRIGPTASFVDVGCGPTVHHLFPAAPYAARLHAFDFVPQCVAEVERWRDQVPPVHNWGPWLITTLDSEGVSPTPQAVSAREAQIREKLEVVGRCDLRSSSPLPVDGKYPVVGCFYTTEQAAMVEGSWSTERRHIAWRRVLDNLVSLVASQGWLLMSSVGYTDHYVTYDAGKGRPLAHPLPFLTEQSYSEALGQLGFNLQTADIRRVPVTGQESEGVTDVLLVAAQRIN